MRANVCALGIDVEPAERLPSELLELVATPQERLKLGDDPYRGRLLFVAKEAVYKAVYPLDRKFLEHHDVQVNLKERKAIVHNGRIVELRFFGGLNLEEIAEVIGVAPITVSREWAKARAWLYREVTRDLPKRDLGR